MSLCTSSGLLLAGLLTLQGGAAQVPASPQAQRPRLVRGDVDRDGRVDLFAIDPVGRDLLLSNEGGGRFVDVTADRGMPALAHVQAAAFGDHDQDGWPDLFLLTRDGRGRLLRNVEGRVFEDVTQAVGLAAHPFADDVRWDDLDADGRPDLHLSGARGDTLFLNAGGFFEPVELPRHLLPGALVAGDTPLLAGGVVPFAGAATAESVGPDDVARARRSPGARGAAAATAAPGAGPGPAGGVIPTPGAGVPAGGGGGPGPSAGGTQPLLVDRSIPSGFSILGDVGARAPAGYVATGETIETNGDKWFVPELPAMPGADDIPETRLLAAGVVARDITGNERLFVFGGSMDQTDTYRRSGFKFDAEAPRAQMPSQQWAPITDMPQPARAAHAAVEVDNTIYSLGGENATLTFANVDAYDPVTDVWSQVPAMTLPNPVRGAAAAAIGRRIYVFGGSNAAGLPQNTLLVFDLDVPAGGWTTLTPGGINPTPRDLPLLVEYGGKLYAIGGSTGLAFSDVVEEYDPLLNRWEGRTPRPVGFRAATSTVANGKILVIGGENLMPIELVHEYDPLEDNWALRQDMLTPRSQTVAGRLCKSTYVVGGLETMGAMSMPAPVNEEYLENQNEKAVFEKM